MIESIQVTDWKLQMILYWLDMQEFYSRIIDMLPKMLGIEDD